jgi:hypothetical protein
MAASVSRRTQLPPEGGAPPVDEDSFPAIEMEEAVMGIFSAGEDGYV